MAAITVRRLSFRCPAVASFVAVLVLCLLRVTVGVRYGQRAQTIHLSDELRNVAFNGNPVTIDVPDLTDGILQELDASAGHIRDAVDAPLLHRHKRAANTTDTSRITVAKCHLNDSHTQLIVHWAGEGSDVIIALARFNADGGTSSLFVSQNYGKTFRNMNYALDGAAIHRYYNSPVHNSHYVFTDIKSKRIFTSRTFATTFSSYRLSFIPRTVSMHSTDPNIILAMDENSESKNLYISRNFGATWTLMQSKVKSFFWGVEPYDSPNTLYIEREEWKNYNIILKSTDYYHTRKTVFRGAVDFEVQSNYMFVTKKVHLFGSAQRSNLQLWVSRNRGPFSRAVFPLKLNELDYYIADASEDQVFVCVNHNKSTSHLYISDTEGLHYTLSLSRILYFNPNGSNNDTWLRLYKDESFADIHKVDGLRGVYIASQLKNNSLILENQISYITFDKGGLWQPLLAPEKDSNGLPTHCDKQRGCSLHLSQEFSKLYPGSKAVPILSKKSAPGLILASGTMGKNLKKRPNVYLSRDAGLRWSEALKGNYFYSFGDFGGVIVAVVQFSTTNEFLYSKNMGETWEKHQFTSAPIRVYGLLTEPGESSTVFSIFGSHTGAHSWLILQVNVSQIFEGTKCSKDDYKDWSLSDDVHFHGCLLGRKTVFKRRIPHANCLTGPSFQQVSVVRNCSCTRLDYECDYGFKEAPDFSMGCVLDPAMNHTDVHEQPSICPPDTFYRYTKGYRRVPGDTCEGGEQHRYDPFMYSCPVQEKSEFLLYSSRHQIHQVDLGGTPNDKVIVEHFLQNAVALDFDYEDNCLFWADISMDVIKKLCLTNMTKLTTLVSERLDTVEGLAYDWLGGNLYWVDSGNQKIEVAKKDGRFRRVLINGTRYLDKPRAIVLDPQNGYMYWSDWSSAKPRIVKASMDGDASTVKIIVSGSTYVQWPNGLAIDYQLGYLYWTDAHLDQIVRSDLNGSNRKVLIHGSRLVPHPYSIAVYKGLIYWSDWSLRAILAADKLTGGGRHIFLSVTNIMDIKILTKNSQNGENPCSLHQECSQLCLAKPDGPGRASRTCLCEDGMQRSKTAKGRDEMCVCQEHEDIVNGSCIPSGNSSCSHQQFHCPTSNKCIPLTWKCDHDDDCGDQSDEKDCAYHDCGSGMFTCDNRRCIALSWKCDHDDDCHDGSDEQNCNYTRCSSDQFPCANKRCIPIRWRCDLDNDCHDGSDELNCNQTSSCGPEQMLCPGTQHQCIPNAWKCDGGHDCPNGTDELNCHNHTCVANYFKCNNTNCIVERFLCDGQDDCGDNSDENLPQCHTTPRTYPTVKTTTDSGRCHNWQFRCENGHCVWWSVHCDGINDCGDYSDERNCHYNVTTPRVTSTRRPPEGCSHLQYTCLDGSCIDSALECDGTADCRNGEEEKGCIDIESCKPGYLPCESVKGCFKEEDVCNNKWDCADGTDEHCNFTIHSGCNFPWKIPCRDWDSCVEPYQMCDRTKQCFDLSDERPDCQNISRVHSPKVISRKAREVTLTWIAPNTTNSVLYNVSYINIDTDVPLQINRTSSTTNITITNLTPYTHYRVYVYVVEKIGGKNVVHYPGTPSLFRTREDVPGCPTDLYVHQHLAANSHIAVRVRWNEAAPKNGVLVLYKIYFKDAVSSAIQYKALWRKDFPSALVKEKSYSFDFDALEQGHKYYIWVTATNDAGESDCQSSKQSITYGSGFIHPVQLKEVGATNTSVTLSWNLSSVLYGYRLSYKNIWGQQMLNQSRKSPYTVTNLSPAHQYNFVIQPFNASTNGSISSLAVRTKGQPLEVPKNVTVDSVGRGTMNVSWKYPGSHTFRVFYDYKYQTREHFAAMAKSVQGRGNSVLVQNLLACEMYTFAVAVDGSVKSQLSDFIPKVTDADRTAAPKNLQVKAKKSDPTCFNLTWESPCYHNPESVSYIIEIVEVLEGRALPPSYIYVNSTNSPKMNKMLCNATRSAEYHLRVKTSIPGVKSRFSESKTFQTEKYKAITTFRLLGNNIENLIFTWTDSEKLPKDHNHLLQYQEFHGPFIDYAKTPDNKIEFPLSLLTASTNYSFRIQLFVNGHRGEGSNEFQYQRRLAIAAPATVTEIPLNVTSSRSSHNEVPLPSNPRSSPKTSTNLVAIVVPIAALVVILVIILLVFVVRHHRLQRSFLSFARSHYDTRSGTTTFTSDDLGEDEDSPMITGFSDDEPLVLA